MAFYCEEPDHKKMVKFIKMVEKNPLCYGCDNVSSTRCFFHGTIEEMRKMVKDLKKKGCKFEREELIELMK